VGTIGRFAVCIEQRGEVLCAKVASGSSRSLGGMRKDAHATISSYFALDHPLADICASFPNDPIKMNEARDFCRGLADRSQPKLECLATFICSSMKQMAHIRQISLALRRRFGEDEQSRYVATRFRWLSGLPVPLRMICRNAAGLSRQKLLASARLVSSGKRTWRRGRLWPIPISERNCVRWPGVE